MIRTIFLSLTLLLLFACMKEEKELCEFLSEKTECKNIKLLYSFEGLKHTVNLTIDGSKNVNNHSDAYDLAGRVALTVIEMADVNKLAECESVKIKFINPDYPDVFSDSYYEFSIPDLRKAKIFIDLNEKILQGYFLGDYMFAKEKMDSVQIQKVDSLLKSRVAKSSTLKNIEFLKFKIFKDSTGNKYTGVLSAVTLDNETIPLTLLFDNEGRTVIEIHREKIKD